MTNSRQGPTTGATKDSSGNLEALANEMGGDMGFDDQMAAFDDKSKNGILNDIRNSVLVKAINEDDEIKGAEARAATLADFKIIVVLGKGTFGKVFLAEYQKEKKFYAIKVIRKDILIEYN